MLALVGLVSHHSQGVPETHVWSVLLESYGFPQFVKLFFICCLRSSFHPCGCHRVASRLHQMRPQNFVCTSGSSVRRLPSLAPYGPKFNGHVFTFAPVSRFILTHSNRFGLLLARRSTLPSQIQLLQLPSVCSQPSCHPTEDQHISPTHYQTKHCPCKICQCQTSVQVLEFLNLSGISGFSRPDKPVFRFFVRITVFCSATVIVVAELGIQPLIRSFWTETSAITFSTFSIAVTVFLRPPTVATGA